VKELNQILLNDHIFQPLLRAEKYFKDNSESLDGKFPYERAEQIQKEVIKLGIFEDRKNYMDRMRLIITKIGNALGYYLTFISFLVL
jgi:WASH complex subunit 7